MFLYNCLHDLNDLNFGNIAVTNENQFLRNGNDIISVKGLPRKEMYFTYYHHRIVKLWNILPDNIKEIDYEDTGTTVG